MSEAPIRLSDLPVGTIARLASTDLDTDARRTLQALGLSLSSRFRLCTAHEPYIVQVKATRIGLSKAVARGLFVTVEKTESA